MTSTRTPDQPISTPHQNQRKQPSWPEPLSAHQSSEPSAFPTYEASVPRWTYLRCCYCHCLAQDSAERTMDRKSFSMRKLADASWAPWVEQFGHLSARLRFARHRREQTRTHLGVR
uniref:(northern house mosquito) hypothetical protein n=1 Tax=Culex pipiens TaxID=7175 RepID=A0A8D8B6V6_CULPI